MELLLLSTHPIDMNAIAGTCEEHLALPWRRVQGRPSRSWQVARASDPLNSQAPAVLETAKRVEELEHKINTHQTEHGCLHHVPLRTDR